MNRDRSTSIALLLIVLCYVAAYSQQHYPVTGVVLSVDRSKKQMVVSCQAIQGFMDAMVMPFTVPDAESLKAIQRGTLIDFVLVVNKDLSHAENIHARRYVGIEREPSKSRRLQGFDEDLRGPLHR